MTDGLATRLRRVDPTAYVHVDAVVPNTESSKRTKTDWDGATGSGFTTMETGGARLTGSLSALVEHTGVTDYLTALSPGGLLPFDVMRIRWNGPESSETLLQRLKLYLHPRTDGGQPQEVVRWRVRLFAVARFNFWTPFLGSPTYDLELVPLGDYVDVVAGAAAGLVTFDFRDAGVAGGGVRPKQITCQPGAVVTREPLTGDVTDYINQAVTFVAVYALTATGEKAGNVGFGYDSGQAVQDTGGNEIATRTLVFHLAAGQAGKTGAFLDQGDAGGAPIATVETESYSAATATFEDPGNRLDLGATPSGTVEFLARGEVPAGTSLTFEVRNDADSAWVAFQDGDTTDDLAGVGKNATYKVRVTLTPDAGGDVTPRVKLLGVRERTRTPLPNLTRIEGPRWAVDPRTLKGEIGEATLTVLRDGEQDFQDAITALLAANDPGDLEFEVYLGASDLARAAWLHLDTFAVDEYATTAAGITLTLVTHLSRLRQALPRPQLLTTSGVSLTFVARSGTTPAKITRASGSFVSDGYQDGDLVVITGSSSNDKMVQVAAVGATALDLEQGATLTAEGPTSAPTLRSWVRRTYTPPSSPTLKSVWDDLMDSALAVPGRMRGPGVEDSTTTGLANKAVPDGDAKVELDAIAAIAGGGNISSQGQIKFVPLFGTQGIAAAFPQEEISVLEMTPGLRRRVAESFVKYDWEESEERFRAEVRGANAPALAAMGEAYVEPYRTDEEIGKWIAADALAQTLADRDVRYRGAGIPTWRFRSTYGYPELEPGDLVAVEAEPFVLRDPFTAASVRGRLWALGLIVVTEGCEGRDFTIWIRQFQDFLPAYTTYDLLPTVPPTVEVYLTPVAGTPGQLAARFGTVFGATVYYQVTDWGAAVPDYGDGSFSTYSAPFVVTQLESLDRQLVFYAQRNGLRSAIRIVRIDKDTAPEASLSILQYDATNVQPQWTVDDDVVFVRLYRKKNGSGNGWPTLNDNVDGQLDQAQLVGTLYVREDGGSWDSAGSPLANIVDSAGTLRTGIGGTRWRESGYTTSDVVKCIAVPFDRNGDPGTRATASLTVAGSGGAALTAFSTAKTAAGSSCGSPAQITVSWTPNVSVADGTHDLGIYRRLNGGGWSLVKTETAPATTTSYVDNVDDYESAGSGLNLSWQYKYELVDTVPTVLDSGQADPVVIESSGTCPLSE